MVLLYSVFTALKEETAYYIFLEYIGTGVTIKAELFEPRIVIHLKLV